MNVLLISSHDLVGQQFNGLLLHRALRARGHDSLMMVKHRDSGEPGVIPVGGKDSGVASACASWAERELGISSLLPGAAFSFAHRDRLRRADVVHLQLLHSVSYFSLFNIPRISRRRPVVWTMHDPWLLSGHCLHPLGCEKWLTGCGKCPDLALPIPVKRDATAFMWRVKRRVMRRSPLTLVVTSRWMLEQVRRSPITSHLPCCLIPFGVDPEVFRPRDKAACRARLGIPQDARVIMFRNAPNFCYKGTAYAEEALRLLATDKPVCLLTLDDPHGLTTLREKYRIVELGWVSDRERIAEALGAADLFLMPSIAETFGMMAVEAMACGTPVVVFEGTSLPDVIHAPRGGVAVRSRDSQALAAALARLLERPGERQELAAEALRIVGEEYTLERYVERHLELYASLISGERPRHSSRESRWTRQDRT